MIISDFYTTIRNTFARGTALDAMIPLWASEACALIEQEWSYAWMRRTGTVTVDPDAATPNQIAFPNARVKSFDFVKRLFQDPSQDNWTVQAELKGVDPKDVVAINSGVPSAYWLDGVDYIYLDTNPTEETTLFMGWNEFTSWPVSTSAEPAILIRATSLMICTTLLIGAQRTRDARMVSEYAEFTQFARTAARAADTELSYKHQNALRAEYAPLG